MLIMLVRILNATTVEISIAISLMRIRATVTVTTINYNALFGLRQKHEDVELAEYLSEFEYWLFVFDLSKVIGGFKAKYLEHTNNFGTSKK